ncbi:MAG: tRNA (adenosine(37)-N6)-threonylcarbamoyltransferase complex dimerization subunit type 1 TsaB [Lachnospiraceae bacterium]|nr:tRNA (adenosine(37)-N6)-threonylcarbamoyltransferase complex dimerization subunit type 1 TsaB [Lachnospiraceae bacterium]
MKILGIDSSGMVASAAIIADGVLASEFTVNNKQTHSQTLLPMIEKVVDMSGVSLESLDAIAVAAGPGSFTGLRIGASTAKGMGLALKKPIVPVPTLEGLAYRVGVADGLICPMMDARRNQVYTGIYRIADSGLECLEEQCAVAIEEIGEKMNALGERVILLGDGIPVHMEYLKSKLSVPYVVAPVHLNRQSGAAVAALGEIYFHAGRMEEAGQHRPIYLRKSQAEREREQRMKGSGDGGA